MSTQPIPLNLLVPGKANVRKTQPAAGIEELAANIKALGLLQNLQVREAEGGKYEVVAGRRRLLALKLLAKGKHIAKDEAIDCRVLAEGEDASEISLAENVMRLPMHPADQFEAFKEMADQGKGVEDIAARFGCAVSTVKQRMRLASVSPVLLKAYRKDAMTLDQLMAFTVSDDHARQMEVWKELPEYSRRPDTIRRILTEAHAEATDPLAVFVGLDAYVAAGGGILRDLFQERHEGYLTDTELLERLASERLEREADSVRAEGWKWVEIMPDLDYSTLRQFRRVHPERQPLSAEQEAELSHLCEAHDAFVAEHGDEPSEDKAGEYEALCDRIDTLERGHTAWNAEDVARAGAVVAVGHAGKLTIERGFVRPEDMPAREPETGDTGGTGKAKADKHESSELSGVLVEDLTAQRTAALRATLAEQPEIALVAVVHAMALPLFYVYGASSVLTLRFDEADLRSSAPGIEGSPALQSLAECEARWRRELPQNELAFWPWCLEQNQPTLLALAESEGKRPPIPTQGGH